MKRDYEYGGVVGTFIFHGEEGWKLMKTDSFSNLVVVHICKKDPKHRSQWKYQGQLPCHFCGKPAPDEVQALRILYNGDV